MAKKSLPSDVVMVRRKRGPSKYNIEIGKLLKEGYNMAEAQKIYREEHGVKKAPARKRPVGRPRKVGRPKKKSE